MNKLILVIFFLQFTLAAIGQTYTYNKLIKKATVQTSSGNEIRIIGTYQGPYKFIFETPNDHQIKKLFTLLSPDQSNRPGLPWYGLLKEMGYVEKDGLIYKKYLYSYTGGNGEQVLVMYPDNYSAIIIFKSDDTIWEYRNQ
jgi:hypothetical protein